MSKEMEPQQQLPGMPNNDSNTSGDNSPRTPEELQEYTAEIARKIAEAADERGPIEYEDRTSEAARDQGWGFIDIRTIPEDKPGDRNAAKARGTHPSMGTIKPLPQRGINIESRHGDSERDVGSPDYHKPAPKPLTPKEIETNVRRLPGARDAITAGPDPDDVESLPSQTGPVRSPEEIETGRAAIQNIRDNVLPFNRQNKP